MENHTQRKRRNHWVLIVLATLMGSSNEIFFKNFWVAILALIAAFTADFISGLSFPRPEVLKLSFSSISNDIKREDKLSWLRFFALWLTSACSWEIVMGEKYFNNPLTICLGFFFSLVGTLIAASIGISFKETRLRNFLAYRE